MNQLYAKCPKCKQLLDVEQYNLADFSACSSCHASVQVLAYPALYRKEVCSDSACAASLEDAACYYHPEKRAEKVCDSCGRFLCALCELPFGEETVCASCLEATRAKKGQLKLQPRQVRYDKVACYLALLPLLYFPLTFVTAPASLFVVIRYWKLPEGFVPKYRSTMRIAGLFALLEIGGWIFAGRALFLHLAGGG